MSKLHEAIIDPNATNDLEALTKTIAEATARRTIAMLIEQGYLSNSHQNAQNSHQNLSPARTPLRELVMTKSLYTSMYLPELDYLIWVTRVRGEFRKGFYTAQGTMKLDNVRNNQNMQNIQDHTQAATLYGYEITGYQGKSHDVILPSTALFRDVAMRYGVEYKQDYRLNPRAQSFYMKGVMDAGNNNVPYKTNASCYTVHLMTPLSDSVLDVTEQYWQNITPEEEAMRIISRADMLRLIAEFRDGTKTPANVPWVAYEANGVSTVDPRNWSALLNPKRVTVAGYEDDAEELVSEWDE